MVKDGFCPRCLGMVKKGHTLFHSETRGVVLQLKANECIAPEYRGKLILIPEEKMDEILPRKEGDNGQGNNQAGKT